METTRSRSLSKNYRRFPSRSPSPSKNSITRTSSPSKNSTSRSPSPSKNSTKFPSRSPSPPKNSTGFSSRSRSASINSRRFYSKSPSSSIKSRRFPSRSPSPVKNSRISPSRSPSLSPSRSLSPAENSRLTPPRNKISLNLLDLPKDILETEILGKLNEFEKVPLKITSKKLTKLIPKSSITGEEWQIKNAILINDIASIKRYHKLLQKKLPKYWLLFLMDDDIFSQVTPETFSYIIDQIYKRDFNNLLWSDLISILFESIQKYNKNTDVQLKSLIKNCIKSDEIVFSIYLFLERNKLNLQHSEIKNLIKKLKVISSVLSEDQMYYFQALKFLEILELLEKY
jgi:hypothetical protein